MKYEAYACPPQELSIAGAKERLADGSVVYYLPCGSVVVRSTIILRGRCRPEDVGLSGCRLIQRLVVIRGVQIAESCITDDDGRVRYITLTCGGRKLMALYYPTRRTLVMFTGSAPLEECLEEVRHCYD